MITEQQRKERINYIGSSDAAKVLAVSSWGSPISVWSVKTGLLEEEDVSQKLKVKVGTKMEAVIAELYEEQTGKKVRRVNETIYHRKYPFLAANIDRRIVGENTILEIKSTGSHMRKYWMDEEIPMETIIQVYHQLAITGLPKAEVCALIGNGDDLIIKEIPRDEKIISSIIEKEVEFWQKYVVPKVMPTTVTKDDADVLLKIFPEAAEGKEVILGDEADQLIEGLIAFQADYLNLEGLIEKQKNHLKKLLGDAAIGTTRLYRVGWVNSKWSGIDAEALKEAHPEIHKQFYKTKPTRRFSHKKLRPEEALQWQKQKTSQTQSTVKS